MKTKKKVRPNLNDGERALVNELKAQLKAPELSAEAKARINRKIKRVQADAKKRAEERYENKRKVAILASIPKREDYPTEQDWFVAKETLRLDNYERSCLVTQYDPEAKAYAIDHANKALKEIEAERRKLGIAASNRIEPKTTESDDEGPSYTKLRFLNTLPDADVPETESEKESAALRKLSDEKLAETFSKEKLFHSLGGTASSAMRIEAIRQEIDRREAAKPKVESEDSVREDADTAQMSNRKSAIVKIAAWKIQGMSLLVSEDGSTLELSPDIEIVGEVSMSALMAAIAQRKKLERTVPVSEGLIR
ncbi:MAG: hypothetical protein LAN36_11495 [Acidobacteriia bacterium]|nr:hypothetical protein [Terriglobia bacterium]